MNNPSLTFFHANANGTGCAVKFALHPADGVSDGYIQVRMANQATIGNRLASPPVYPTFDWDGCASFDMSFDDLSKMIQVFRGECESMEDGKGLYYAKKGGNRCRVCLRHVIDPVCGYSFEAYCSDDRISVSYRIFLSNSEALGLCLALEQAMIRIAFG